MQVRVGGVCLAHSSVVYGESTAAAFSYGMNNKEGNFAIFDIGKGTFDVSILKISR